MRRWLAIGALAGFASSSYCMPAKSAEPPLRAQSRAIVLNAAFALKAADEVCAEKVMSLPVEDAKMLAIKCIAAIEEGRDALVAAESILDSWDEGQAGKMYCAAKDGIEALQHVATVLKRAGVSVPSEIDDAVAVAGWISHLCADKR